MLIKKTPNPKDFSLLNMILFIWLNNLFVDDKLSEELFTTKLCLYFYIIFPIKLPLIIILVCFCH